MGKIFCLIGKSASGKDSIYSRLLRNKELKLKPVIPYTTRPLRKGEKDGESYFFRSDEEARKMEEQGRIIELRAYDTIYGVWKYFTVNDGQISLDEKDYLVIGTLESYAEMRRYFGSEKVIGIYIEVEDGIRLERALKREQQQANPKYAEMCRRFLADQDDFSEEKLEQAGIERRFCNVEFETCVEEICRFIVSDQNGERVYRER